MSTLYKFVPLDGDSRRQYINARDVLAASRATQHEARSLTGNLVWRAQNGREYLIRVSKQGTQTSLGPKSVKTETVHQEFHRRKAIVLERLEALQRKMQVHARLNRVYNIARVDSMLVDVLNGFYLAGMTDNIVVVDPNALFCYEIAAGVRIEPTTPASEPASVMWHECRQLTLSAPGGLTPSGLLSILTRIDKSFELTSSTEFYAAVNSKGYQIKLMRQKRAANDHSSRSKNGESFWTVAARDFDWLLLAPTFQSIVVGKKGTMAQMTTLDPRAMTLFWRWMSEQKYQDKPVRHRYAAQADMLTKLIGQYLPQFPFNELPGIVD